MDRPSTPAVVVPPAEAEPQPVARARGARMAVLIGAREGAPRFITRRFLLDPGARIPLHRHDTIEHEQVVVRGEMVITLDGERRVVRAGDAVFLPAGCAHAYENLGADEVEFICVVPSSRDYQTEWLEDPPPGACAG
ncbi:MAG: cupin domain-containing protein [Acidobacteriota bacterium]